MADYNKVGLLVIRDTDKAVLLCRKHGLSRYLILPGGQLEPGETVRECLAREIREELGGIMIDHVERVGVYEDIAASDDPSEVKTVNIELFQGHLVGRPMATGEIRELVWFKAGSDHEELSPILANKILPDLIGRGILDWLWR